MAKVVSTLVYLDGETLTNADVANAELKGTMNIQFSSSAELIPMEYGDLLNGNVEEKSEYTVTVNGVKAEQKVAKGTTYTANINSYTSYIPEGKTITDVTVTMGGAEVENAYNASTGLVKVENVSGDLVVSVTLEWTVTRTENAVVGGTTAAPGQDYTFSMKDGWRLDSITIDGVAMSPLPTANGDGSYTILGAYVTGPIVIAATPG